MAKAKDYALKVFRTLENGEWVDCTPPKIIGVYHGKTALYRALKDHADEIKLDDCEGFRYEFRKDALNANEYLGVAQVILADCKSESTVPAHPRGKKFYYVRWLTSYHDSCQLVSTSNREEDAEILAWHDTHNYDYPEFKFERVTYDEASKLIPRACDRVYPWLLVRELFVDAPPYERSKPFEQIFWYVD